MKKPNTHFKDPSEYEYRKEKLEDCGIDDINDDHVGVTTTLDSKMRKQCRKHTNIIRSQQVRFEPAIDEIVGGTTSQDEDSDSAARRSGSLRGEGSESVAFASVVGMDLTVIARAQPVVRSDRSLLVIWRTYPHRRSFFVRRR